MSTHQYIAFGDTVYLYFASNDTSGSGDDGASAAFYVRQAGDGAGADPVYNGSATLLSTTGTAIEYPSGCYEVAIAATGGNGFGSSATYAVFATLAVDSQNPTGFIGSFRTAPVNANITEVLGVSATADGNDYLNVNTAALSDDVITSGKYDESTAYPLAKADSGTTILAREEDGSATYTLKTLSSQIGGISGGGSAINQDAESYTLTTGTQTTGTFANASNIDGVYHGITNAAGTLDYYYQMDIGTTATPVEVSVNGRLDEGSPPSGSDTVDIVAYNNDTTSFEVVKGTAFTGINGSTSANDTTEVATLFARHVDSSGKVKVGIQGSSLEANTEMLIDQIVVSYTQTGSTTGYQNGAIWVDTNNGESGSIVNVNGVADNKVDNWADALTLNSQLRFDKFIISNDSTITLTGDSTHYALLGDGLFNLSLGSQVVTHAKFYNASISGTGTGSNVLIEDCEINAGTSLPACYAVRCGFAGTSGSPVTSSGTGQYVFVECVSLVAGSGTPYFDFSGEGGAVGVNNRDWKGGAHITLDSDCTMSHEVVVGGGTTIITGGADVEVRGITRALTVTLSGSETVQFVGITGPITIDGTATAAVVNLYGDSTSLTDTSTGSTVTDGTNQSVVISMGDNTITSAVIADDAIDAASIATGAFTADAFAADALVAATFATDSITADAIADNAIDAGAIADNAIDSGAIASNAITADAIADDAIDAGSIATGAFTADAFAADALVAATFATDSITADAIAADAVTEIQSGMATQAKLLAYTQLIARSDSAIATDNATELAEINADGGSGAGDYANTTDSQEALQSLGNATYLMTVEIVADTSEIGVAGAGLTDLGGMSTGMKAEVQSEANDALVAQKLDHLVAVADSDDPVDNSIMAKLASTTGDWSTFASSDDALQAIRDRGDAAWITATSVTVSDKTGFKLAIDGLDLVTAWTTDITGTWTGNLTGSVNSVTTGVSLTEAERNSTADAILVRAVENVEDTADKHSLGATIMISTNSSISGTTLTAKKPSDDSTFQTYTVTVDASADPITGVS